MKNILFKNIGFTLFWLLISTATIYWIEADKELRILCSLFQPGKSTEYVSNTLETANLLSYDLQENPLNIESSYNLKSSECELSFSEQDQVISKTFIQYFDLIYFLSWISVTLTLLLAGFQLLLALGFPLGAFAWGGKFITLPRNLRIGSAVSVLIFLFIAFLLIKFISGAPVLPQAYPVLGVLFLINSYMNLNSESAPEMLTMTPVAVILFISFLSLSIAG